MTAALGLALLLGSGPLFACSTLQPRDPDAARLGGAGVEAERGEVGKGSIVWEGLAPDPARVAERRAALASAPEEPYAQAEAQVALAIETGEPADRARARATIASARAVRDSERVATAHLWLSSLAESERDYATAEAEARLAASAPGFSRADDGLLRVAWCRVHADDIPAAMDGMLAAAALAARLGHAARHDEAMQELVYIGLYHGRAESLRATLGEALVPLAEAVATRQRSRGDAEGWHHLIAALPDHPRAASWALADAEARWWRYGGRAGLEAILALPSAYGPGSGWAARAAPAVREEAFAAIEAAMRRAALLVPEGTPWDPGTLEEELEPGVRAVWGLYLATFPTSAHAAEIRRVQARYHTLRRWPGALEAYEVLFAADPDDPEAAVGTLVAALEQIHEPERAVEAAARFLARRPEDPWAPTAWLLDGYARARMGTPTRRGRASRGWSPWRRARWRRSAPRRRSPREGSRGTW